MSQQPKLNSFLGGNKLLVLILSTVFIGSIAYGLFITGTPSSERNRRLDETREHDLNNVLSTVEVYWNATKILPEKLSDLDRADRAFYIRNKVDPQTNTSYEYRKLDARTYLVCGNFLTEKKVDPNQPNFPKPLYPNFDLHPAGHFCIQHVPIDLNIK